MWNTISRGMGVSGGGLQKKGLREQQRKKCFNQHGSGQEAVAFLNGVRQKLCGGT